LWLSFFGSGSSGLGKTDMQKDLGRYQLTEDLGSGGMAAVYKAYDQHLNRTVAIKVILPGLQQSDVLLKRFEREARAVAQLSHPNIVSVIDYGSHDGAPYLVMEYISGGSLKDQLGQPLPWQEAARKLIPVAQALQYAHEQGIIHRDIKPANVLVTATGDLMLSDFGLAKLIGSEEGIHLTQTGAQPGTPAYMAPEQSLGKPIDVRSDVYSLGIVFYEMITGRKPFQAETAMAVMLQHVTDALPAPRQFAPELPAAVEQVACKALEKAPEWRFQSMAAFAQALETLLQRDYHGQLTAFDQLNLDDATTINEATIMERPGVPAASKPFHVSESTLPPGQRRNIWPWALGGVTLLCVLFVGAALAGGTAYGLWQSARQPSPVPPERAAAAVMAATPTAQPSTQSAAVADVVTTASPSLAPTHTPIPSSPTALPTATVVPTATAVPTAASTPFGGGRWIAFQSDRAGNNDIYVMESDGSGVTQLTFGLADDRAPAWSPDGREIAFQSNEGGDYEIYAVNVLGGQIRQITRNECNDHSPVYSPNGRQLVYYSDCDGNREIYVIDVSGGNIRQLTQTTEMYNWFPSWSPDGREIVFSSNRSGAYQVYVMDADGSAVRALAKGCVPFFSPDGRQIIFNQYCTDSGNIWRVNADGSDARALTEAPFDNNRNPNWAADGTKIIFQSEQTGNFEIWIMDADGGNPHQLTDNSAMDAVPVWQPGIVQP
jgi:serine/threonine protein kinase/Tol biopolymer transport system component